MFLIAASGKLSANCAFSLASINWSAPLLKAQFAESFPEAAIKNIKWYPAVPAGLEAIEGKILDKVKAAN